jgi:murein DD-endopeptidase MepM/ murein hydrolase activator NlpD
MKKLTEIGFHQAAYSWALSMKTAMKNADLSLVARTRTTGRDRAEQPSGPDAIMTGKVLRMWRSSRSGRPDTAADVGALAGTTVLSPVTGTVVRVKSYKLYGRYQDFEMHIIPDDTHGIDDVLIHLTDVSVKPGDRVEGGVTPVAKVRKLSDKFHDQLADYPKSPGDHVHMQVNDSTYRGYRGLDGAVDPSEDASPTASD